MVLPLLQGRHRQRLASGGSRLPAGGTSCSPPVRAWPRARSSPWVGREPGPALGEQAAYPVHVPVPAPVRSWRERPAPPPGRRLQQQRRSPAARAAALALEEDIDGIGVAAARQCRPSDVDGPAWRANVTRDRHASRPVKAGQLARYVPLGAPAPQHVGEGEG